MVEQSFANFFFFFPQRYRTERTQRAMARETKRGFLFEGKKGKGKGEKKKPPPPPLLQTIGQHGLPYLARMMRSKEEEERGGKRKRKGKAVRGFRTWCWSPALVHQLSLMNCARKEKKEGKKPALRHDRFAVQIPLPEELYAQRRKREKGGGGDAGIRKSIETGVSLANDSRTEETAGGRKGGKEKRKGITWGSSVDLC